MNPVTAMQRTLVKATLRGWRLPLTVIQRVTNNVDAPDWPPAVAFESFEAAVKRVVGTLIRDDELVGEGRRQQAKAEELAQAGRRRTQAEQTRKAADTELQQRRQSAAEARADVADAARERQRRLDEREEASKRAAAERSRQRQEEAAEAARRQDKVVSATQRAARRTRISRESAALSERREALSAKKRATDLEDSLEAKKRQRKS